MAAQSEPWICARAVVRVGAEISTSREDLLRSAGLSFLQGRYQDAAKAVKSAAELGVELSSLELQLFDEICRSALKSLKEQAAVARSESYNSEDEVVHLLNEIVELIENCLLPLCPLQDCVVYNCLKGDIFTFFADTFDSSEHNSKAISAYEEAFEHASQTCNAVHPFRIRAAVNLATSLDKSEYSLRGYKIVSKAVEDIENELKCTRNCSPELKSRFLLLNNLKEQFHVKLTGRKAVLPYAEMIPLKEQMHLKLTSRKAPEQEEAAPEQEEDLEMYWLGNKASEEDELKKRKLLQLKGKENEDEGQGQ